jgi:hypothetical protein
LSTAQFELDYIVAGHSSVGDAQVPFIAQQAEPRRPTPAFGHTRLTIEQFVSTTGGEYFFSPSISALEQLARAQTAGNMRRPGRRATSGVPGRERALRSAG